MPDGTIPDPRMNPHKERQFGIIEINGVYAYYDKINKHNNKRFMPFGFLVREDMITLKQKNPPYPIIFRGQLINLKAKFDIPDDYDLDATQGPVTKAIYLYLKDPAFPGWPAESELDNPVQDKD